MKPLEQKELNYLLDKQTQPPYLTTDERKRLNRLQQKQQKEQHTATGCLIIVVVVVIFVIYVVFFFDKEAYEKEQKEKQEKAKIMAEKEYAEWKRKSFLDKAGKCSYEAYVECKAKIKELALDPDSVKFFDDWDSHKSMHCYRNNNLCFFTIHYSATNSFGARIQNYSKCTIALPFIDYEEKNKRCQPLIDTIG